MGQTELENKEIARKFYSALDNHDRDTFNDVVADELVVDEGEVVITREELWENFVDSFVAPFPDFSESIDHVFAEDDMVAVRWRYTGSHEEGELLGIPPTGKEVEGTGNTHLRIANDEIVQMWVEYDRNSIFRTLDVLPESMYEMKIHRQLLEVMFRVLRHNLRNDLNAITGQAELIAAEEVPGPAYAERIQETAESLLTTAEKARDLEQSVVNVRRRESVDVPEVVGTVLAEQRKRHQAAEITVSLQVQNAEIKSNESLLSVVLEETIENAVIHADTSDPRIEVAVDSGDQEGYAVTITVSDNGPGIPDHELEPLIREREDPLTHGSGIGLWIIKWGIEQLDGEVEFTENQPSGSIIRFRLLDMES